MKEIKAIVQAYNEIDCSIMHAALATVVRVEGSSYRRTGARMLVLENGTWVGGISGGCLEGDALKRARLAINSAKASLITYDTSEDDPHQIGVGLGCNGIIDVLFSPINFKDLNNPIEVLKFCLTSPRKTHVLLCINSIGSTETSLRAGQLIEYKDDTSIQQLGTKKLQAELNLLVKHQIAENRSGTINLKDEANNTLSIFVEILPPEIHVILMGHQYDVYPMSRLLKELGWRVSIIADLIKVNTKIRDLVDHIKPIDALDELVVDEHTAIVLMSHNYKTDKRNLPIALKTKSLFIGMLGPRVRAEKIWQELAEEGFNISVEDMQRIHAPIGLDIGAVSPEEIALSLAAGIKTAFSGRSGQFLRERKSPIYPRD